MENPEDMAIPIHFIYFRFTSGLTSGLISGLTSGLGGTSLGGILIVDQNQERGGGGALIEIAI